MIPDVIAFVGGVVITWYLSRAPELRSWRLFQLVLVPAGFAMLAGLYQASGGKADVIVGVAMVLLIVIIAFLLAPNIAYYCGVGISNFLDPMDWPPVGEIALRPIRRLIDKDRYYEALGDLETLLKNHKPTHEALLLHAKLLHHLGRIDATADALLKSLPLAQTADQQLVVTQLLAELPAPPLAAAPASKSTRRFRIAHDLILFSPNVSDSTESRPADWNAHNPQSAIRSPQWKLLPPGEYEVRESIHAGRLWFVLAGEDWGNAAACWEAVHQVVELAPPTADKGVLQRVAQIHHAIFTAFKGRPRLYAQADADKHFKDAAQYIRQNNWPAARPLLEKAHASDPHRYEIAYRWVQAVRQTSGRAAAMNALKKVLDKERWSENEREMLEQAAQK
jgi:thioredoxin-like negative regulator of GroEL